MDVDASLSGFADAFIQLKVQFTQRVNVDQWKIIQATSKKVDKLVRQSKFLIQYFLSLKFEHLYR